MKVFLGLLSVVGLIAGLPTASRTSSPGEPDECSKECINGVIQYGHDLSILKQSDLSNYFNKIDEICEVISTARKCLESCGATTKSGNPFALESLNIVCQPETQEKIDSIKQCLHYIDSNVNEICTKECGSDRIIDETDVTPSKEQENPMMKKANADCATFKCMSRCNIEVVSNQCGKDLGKEFQALLQQVLDAQRRDLEGLKLVETMAKEFPPECNYLYDPSVLFGSSKIEEASSSPATPHDPKEDAKTLYAQAQLQLLLKQLELAEKQDQLIDRENAKLDMEMSYMAHKAEQREQRFHAAHSIPTFVPMEKMPKEHMPMEPLEVESHPEASMPAESHPPMEEAPSHPEEPHHEQMPMEPRSEQMESHPPMPMEAHPPMEEGHAQPMPPMESHQPSMPMESHPPMDFPHPESSIHGMPMEMNPEMPRHKSSRHSMPPMILEGVPMEFVPMDGVPIELPMHMPMQAMPRFI